MSAAITRTARTWPTVRSEMENGTEVNRTERRDREAQKRRHGMRVSGRSVRVIAEVVVKRAALAVAHRKGVKL